MPPKKKQHVKHAHIWLSIVPASANDIKEKTQEADDITKKSNLIGCDYVNTNFVVEYKKEIYKVVVHAPAMVFMHMDLKETEMALRAFRAAKQEEEDTIIKAEEMKLLVQPTDIILHYIKETLVVRVAIDHIPNAMKKSNAMWFVMKNKCASPPINLALLVDRRYFDWVNQKSIILSVVSSYASYMIEAFGKKH